MATVTFHGESRQGYQFEVYGFDQAFNAVGAVYSVTRRTRKPDGGYEHDVLYVGETGDLSTRFNNHHRAGCFQRHDANAICVHQDGAEHSRLAKETDS